MIHLHSFGYWFLFTFAFVLCNYPIVLRACRMLLCCTLLLFTLYRCQIKDCRYTDTPCPFYPRTGHVPSPKCSTQQAYVITPYPLSIAQCLLLMQVDRSDLQIWNWIVQTACMYIFTAHHHQTACHLFHSPTLFLFRHTDCFDTSCLFHLKKNNKRQHLTGCLSNQLVYFI